MRVSQTASILAVLGAVSTSLANPVSSSAQEDLAFAYEYLYPLYAYGNVAKPLPGIARPNMLLHSGNLSSPETGVGVVRPNADTIYSVVMFDLSHSDLIIEVPEMPQDRYWVFPIVTPYGDHLVNLGSLSKTPAGRYLLSYSADEDYGLVTENAPTGFAGVIKYPMVYGISDMRILANRTDEDIATVLELQSGFKTIPLPRDGEPLGPRLNLSMFNETQYNENLDQDEKYFEAVLRVAALLEPYCPTYVKEDREWVGARLKSAGFHGQEWKQPLDTNLTEAVHQTNVSTEAFMQTVLIEFDNDWIVIEEEYFGLFNSHYNARYSVASIGYLGLTYDQSVYPFNRKPLDLEEGQAVLYTFSEPPKIKDSGFWSLTAYGPDQNLIPNDLGQYSLGSETGLKFPDGSLVTPEGEGKAFQILLQAADMQPPSNWTSNWLPINNGGGSISTTLRWYSAEDAMLDGTYVYPKVEIIDAITE